MLNDEHFSTYQTPFELEQRFSRLIRAGYVGHNHLDLEFGLESEQILSIVNQNSVFRSMPLVPTKGFTIIGISGIGKWRII